MANKKIIKLYIGRDEKSAELFRTLSSIIRQIPSEKRPKLKVRVVKIKNPEDFPDFLEQLEEIFGGLYTLEFRKYNIQSLPAIVVDNEKILEGNFPSYQELLQILAYEGIVISEKAPIIEEEVSKPLIEEKVEKISSTKKDVVEEKINESYVTKPFSFSEAYEERIKEKIEGGGTSKKESLEKVFTPSASEITEVSKPILEKPEKESVSRPVQEEKISVPTETRIEKKSAKGTCFDCIFFDKNRSRCTLLHVDISDPYHPICGRR